MNWRNLTDFVWPTLGPPPNANNQKPPAPWTIATPDAQQAIEQLLKTEEERLKTVDTKLQALLAIAPIVTTLVLGLVTFVTKTPTAYVFTSVVLIVGGGAYVILQFICTVWAAIAGISRKRFRRLTPKDLQPTAGETAEDYRVRIINAQLLCLAHNVTVTDDKVSELALAHRAIQNALGMLLLLVIALGSIAIYNHLHL